MGLGLELRRIERGFEVGPEEGHPIALVALEPQTHPKQMDMVGHQNVSGTEKPFACGGMEHQFAELAVESLREPAFGAVKDAQSPVDDGVALVIFPGKPWKAVGAGVVRVGLGRHGVGEYQRLLTSSPTMSGCRRRRKESHSITKMTGNRHALRLSVSKSKAMLFLLSIAVILAASDCSRQGNHGRRGGLPLRLRLRD